MITFILLAQILVPIMTTHFLGPPTMISGSNACYGLGANGGNSASLTATGASLYIVSTAWCVTCGTSTTPIVTINVAGQGAETMTALTTYGTGQHFRTTLFYLTPAHFGSTYITSVSNTNGFPGFCTRAYSNMATSSVFQSGTDNGSATGCNQPCQSGSDGSPTGSTLVISLVGSFPADSGTYSVDSGFTNLDQIQPVGGTNVGSGIAELIQNLGIAVNPTWSMAAGVAIVPAIAAFKGQ